MPLKLPLGIWRWDLTHCLKELESVVGENAQWPVEKGEVSNTQSLQNNLILEGKRPKGTILIKYPIDQRKNIHMYGFGQNKT